MTFYIKVEVRPGMFPSEKSVSFSADSQRYTLFVDDVDLAGEKLKVDIVDEAPGRWVVRLPRETFTSGRTLSVPREIVEHR